MSAPGPWGCGAENGNCPERKKDRAKNSVIHSPGDGCAEQREGSEEDKAAYCLGVHFCSRLKRGSDQAAPPLCAS
jgi:hypothetical protein